MCAFQWQAELPLSKVLLAMKAGNRVRKFKIDELLNRREYDIKEALKNCTGIQEFELDLIYSYLSRQGKLILQLLLQNENILKCIQVLEIRNVKMNISPNVLANFQRFQRAENEVSEDYVSLVCKLIQQTPSLETIRINHCMLYAKDITQISLEGLEKAASSRISTIDFSWNILTNGETLDWRASSRVDLTSFASYLKRNRSITKLQLNNCKGLSVSDNLKALFDALQENEVFSVLELNHVDIFGEVQPYAKSPLMNTVNIEESLVSFVKSTPSLHSLSILECKISPKALAEILECCHLKSIQTSDFPETLVRSNIEHFSCTSLQASPHHEFFDCIEVWPLYSVHFEMSANLSSQRHLVWSLRSSSLLRYLYLPLCRGRVLQIVLEILKNHQTLEELHLCKSTFDPAAAIALADFLGESKLEKLVLDGSGGLEFSDLPAICKALESNDHLIHLSTSIVLDDSSFFRMLCKVLRVNKRLRIFKVFVQHFARDLLELMNDILLENTAVVDFGTNQDLQLSFDDRVSLQALELRLEQNRGKVQEEIRMTFFQYCRQTAIPSEMIKIILEMSCQ
jgi:hypothetical protein